ncbi:MAG: Holliday junction resolvase Hjc [Candidatus Woesearchaeota archaeon]|jgi:Holliday junction resolvase|nr:Holliday junction resolvase Hjc [Candidatus Woesearchaeota archaeon]
MARFVKNKKAKGTAAENELIHRFWDTNEWVCIRVAGSGSTKYPAPDLLASRGDKKIVMEVKVVNGVKKYFTRQEINDLNFFSEKFGAEAWVGVKFEGNQWYFIPTSELEQTKSENYVIDLITMKRKGFEFEDMIG